MSYISGTKEAKERFVFLHSLHPHPHLPTHPLLLTHRRANHFTSVCHASWTRTMTLVAHTIPHSQHARIRLEYEWFVSFATSQILRGMGTRCQHSLFLLSLLTHPHLVVCVDPPCPSPHSLAHAVVHIHARQSADALRVDAWKASGWMLLDGGSSTFRP
jgi:hypothetical protein